MASLGDHVTRSKAAMFPAQLETSRVLAKSIVMAAFPATAILGCSNEPSFDERIHQQIVVTKFQPNIDFGAFSTFSISNTIPIRTSLDGSAGTDLDPAVAGPTLDAVASQMVSRGYVRVDHTAGPDLGVSVTLVLKLDVSTLPSSPWWYGDPSATASYWGVPGAPVTASWTYVSAAWLSGTLVIDALDVRDAALQLAAGDAGAGEAGVGPGPGSAGIQDVWAAFIHGVVLPNAEQPLMSPPIALIDQAFAQSPYLHRASTGEQNR